MPDKRIITRFRSIIIVLLLVILIFYFAAEKILGGIGNYLIHDDMPIRSEAIIVLNTGVEYYSRLIEAANLYNKGYADKIIINGNRKMDIERELEEMGFEPCCPWYENRLRVLALFKVPRKNVIYISVEDAYDTMSEAEVVGLYLKRTGIKNIIITTSKFHTKRAGFIWKHLYNGQLLIHTVSAKTDPYDPHNWWTDGRQIRWVLAEYGAWIYFYWKRIKEN